MMTMGKGFTDKVTEYRILNEQLMTKALALLKTADDLMVCSKTFKMYIDLRIFTKFYI